MSILSNKSGSAGDILSSGENTGPGRASGWEDEIVHQNIEFKLIQKVNSLMHLQSVFEQYNLVLEQIYSQTGWTRRCVCPFPDHKDASPSFGYNSLEDRFNCFGCGRNGKAVEFIAYMEDRSKLSVAKEIISGLSSGYESITPIERFDFIKLGKILFDFADIIRDFKKKHKCETATKYAEAVTWNLDVYLRKHVPYNTIILYDLEARIFKLKEQIELYEVGV